MLDVLVGWMNLILDLDVFWSSPDGSSSGDVRAMEGCAGMPPKP